MRRTLLRSLLLTLAVICAVTAGATHAAVAPSTAPLASRVNDVDGDAILDDIERRICGSVTCATGLEDIDHDGIPDAIELRQCETRSCAGSADDGDGDGTADHVALQATSAARRMVAVTGAPFAWVSPLSATAGVSLIVVVLADVFRERDGRSRPRGRLVRRRE